MGVVVSCILTLNFSGVYGSLILIIADGLCSSGLFCLSNIYCERFNNRTIYIIKGLLNLFPNLSLWIFLFRVRNIAYNIRHSVN